jgi:hypothetical protein
VNSSVSLPLPSPNYPSHERNSTDRGWCVETEQPHDGGGQLDLMFSLLGGFVFLSSTSLPADAKEQTLANTPAMVFCFFAPPPSFVRHCRDGIHGIILLVILLKISSKILQINSSILASLISAIATLIWMIVGKLLPELMTGSYNPTQFDSQAE